MALTRSWQGIINDKLDLNKIMFSGLKRSELINQLSKKKGWLGTSGTGADKRSYIVNFAGNQPGAVSIGSYADIADIAKFDPIKGMVQSYVETTFSLNFNEEDLLDITNDSEMEAMVNVGVIEQASVLTQQVKNCYEDMFINGSKVLNITDVTYASIGKLTVDRPEKVRVGQMLQLAATAATGTKNQKVFIKSVNKNTKEIEFSTTLGGATASLVGNVGAASATFVCVYGTVATAGTISGFDGYRNVLLSSANGGDSTYLGHTKTTYQFLQALNINGSTWTASDIVPKIFEAWNGEIDYQLMSYKGKKAKSLQVSPANYAKILNSFEMYKGSFRKNDADTLKMFDAGSIAISSLETGGELVFERVPSMPDDIMVLPNMDTWAMVSDRDLAFRKDVGNPNGMNGYKWTETRNSTGFTHTLDGRHRVQTVCGAPEANAIIHGLAL
jgi:hypothetical protein